MQGSEMNVLSTKWVDVMERTLLRRGTLGRNKGPQSGPLFLVEEGGFDIGIFEVALALHKPSFILYLQSFCVVFFICV